MEERYLVISGRVIPSEGYVSENISKFSRSLVWGGIVGERVTSEERKGIVGRLKVCSGSNIRNKLVMPAPVALLPVIS